MLYRAFLVLASVLALGVVFAGEAYRWVDEDGVVHFSDRPRDGAERIRLPEPNVTTTRSRTGLDRNGASMPEEDAEEDAGPFSYESIEVVSPGAEQTLWNIGGVLTVSVAVEPALQPGHQVRFYFDGQERATSQSTSVQIDEVFRGVHNIQAEVIDETGQLMVRSTPNRFYVQQTSVLNRGP